MWLRDRYDDISQNSRLCPKLSNFPQNVFIRNKSIIWHSINNRTSTSPNSAVRLSCRIAECEIPRETCFSLSTNIKKKERKRNSGVSIAQLSTSFSHNYRLKRKYKISKFYILGFFLYFYLNIFFHFQKKIARSMLQLDCFFNGSINHVF